MRLAQRLNELQTIKRVLLQVLFFFMVRRAKRVALERNQMDGHGQTGDLAVQVLHTRLQGGTLQTCGREQAKEASSLLLSN